MKETNQRLILEKMQTKDSVFNQQLEALPEEDRKEILSKGFHRIVKREELAWKLQCYIEKNMYTQSNYDDIEQITEVVLKEWKAHEDIQLSDRTIEWYILRLFKSINHRKAYGEICESDVASYQLFVQDSSLFAQYVIRQLFTYERIPVRMVAQMFEWIYSNHFADDAKEVYKETIKKLNLLDTRTKSRDKKPANGFYINAGKAGAQGRLARAMELPFIQAIEKLYVNQFEQGNQEQRPALVTQFFKDYIWKKTETELVEQVTEQAIAADEPTSDAVVKLEVSVEVEVPVEVAQPTAEHGEIDQIIAQLQQLKTTLQQPVVSQEMTQQADAQMKIAEEEIARLRQTIQEQEEQLKATKTQVQQQLVEQLGGGRSNYLLSDLYSESLGESTLSRELIQGQLLNFFNILGDVMQLEPVTNGYEVGEEFDCSRSDLARQYNILSSIVSEEEQVRVQLLKYGWSVNGKTIVLPQVTELKGAY